MGVDLQGVIAARVPHPQLMGPAYFTGPHQLTQYIDDIAARLNHLALALAVNFRIATRFDQHRALKTLKFASFKCVALYLKSQLNAPKGDALGAMAMREEATDFCLATTSNATSSPKGCAIGRVAVSPTRRASSCSHNFRMHKGFQRVQSSQFRFPG